MYLNQRLQTLGEGSVAPPSPDEKNTGQSQTVSAWLTLSLFHSLPSQWEHRQNPELVLTCWPAEKWAGFGGKNTVTMPTLHRSSSKRLKSL